jgi:stage II sporulation protein D
MMDKFRSFRLRVVLVCLALLIVSGMTPTFRVYGAVPQLKQIRVALIMDSPSYRVTAHAVTVSSPDGVMIGIKGDEAVSPRIRHSGDSAVRVSADRFLIRTPLIADFQTALEQYRRLGSASSAYLFSALKQGKTVYQAAAGPFATLTEARETLSKLSGSLSGAFVTGPFWLETGTFDSEAKALAELNDWTTAGFVAELAVIPTADKPIYTVRVGGALNEQELAKLKDKAAEQLADKKLNSPDRKRPSLLVRADHSVNLTASGSIKHYSFHSDDKVWIQPNKGTLKIAEKSNRTYRGALEASVYNQRLAVVNELPFEEYLYSVVGGEMSANWPAEALKAQAVAARTYALYQGNKFGIAHVVDSTLSQIYTGTASESPSVIAAVQATEGEVLVDRNGKPIETLFSSNSGGQTSDSTEIWGNPVAYLTSRPSPSDDSAAQGLLKWHRVMLADGRSGYIRSDLLQDTGEKTAAGLPYMSVVSDGTNVRPEPEVPSGGSPSPIAKLNRGDRVVRIETVEQNSAYSWIKESANPDTLLQAINARVSEKVPGPLRTLEIAAAGPSGRVTALRANGTPLKVSYPDAFRSALGGLPSTRFDIDETGRYTVLGADGSTREYPNAQDALYVYSEGQAVRAAEEMIVLDGGNRVRLITDSPQFRFIGYGAGHGLGLSQWGAKGLAEQGYDYEAILMHYYSDVRLIKD